MQAELLAIIDVSNRLGEGVVWDDESASVWWTDILAKKIFSYRLADKRLLNWATPEELACFSLVEKKDTILAGFASGFAYYDLTTGNVEWLTKIEAENPASRLNDGRTDRQGRFWVGTLSPSAEGNSPTGSLYCLDAHNDLSVHLTDIEISNSLCWSPDSQFMYHCDTPKQTIRRYEFDPVTAKVGKGIDFASTESHCFPDGSIIDSDGFLLNAQWGGSKVVRYKPNGCVDTELVMPVSQPTCVAIGGPNNDLLFVTSAKEGLTKSEPHAGDLFIYKTNLTGLPEMRYQEKGHV